MKFKTGHFYHLYNRTNNGELMFKEPENYLYFLKKFRSRFHNLLSISAYCLMPTHFHFLVCIKTQDTDRLPHNIGTHLSAYTKAINKRYNRHGSLFQRRSKAKHIENRNYLLTLISYIHQNPIRSNLVDQLKDWPYSSYRDLAGYRDGSLVDESIINSHFNTEDEFITFSNETITSVKSEFWV